MSASRISRIILAALLAGGLSSAIAQDRAVNIDDLKRRSDSGDNKATRQLAEMYYAGRDGVEQDFKEAIRWYERLAKRNDRRAQTTLGTIYARGYGVEKNFDIARYWWTQAAKRDDAGAQYNLGTLYYRGEGVTQDYAEAARWYRQAAQIGHVNSQKNLAGMYWEGRGVEKNPQVAYYWFKVASLLGDDESQESLKIVGKAMPAGQIRDAESQADDWMSKYKKIVGQ
jgi:TPR repeat protein